jgi:hypothetical protein
MTEETVDGIAWTPESRARVYASRRIRNPAYRLSLLEGASVSYPFDAKACRDSALYYWSEKRKLERVEAGLANNPPGWRGAVETALARGKKPKQDIPLDIDVEAATVTLELCPLFAAMPYWLATGGIVFALRTMIRCHELASYAKQHGYSEAGTWILETRRHSFDRPEDNADAWELLRAMLADAVEPIYDEAHGIADEARLRTAGSVANESALQLLLPFAFPDESAWAAAASKPALALAKQAKRGYTPGLARYVAVAPVETAIELLTCTINTAVSADDLVTVLAHHGAEGGARVLEAALDGAANEAQRKTWCEVLLAVRTDEVGRLFARLARRDSKRGGKTFAAFASKHRALLGGPKPKPRSKPKAKSKAKR